ncbi:hypothetical protein IX53_02300 [Kosmotoga pacifica]|uniref:Alpha-amylase n=1 Tax=Kosmotoga pacifica TaxID=1330330 RepID=A0A0G2Z9C7_9BACT|nr:hypothetical protein IX53_02300 [Kosmotoga pacifica]
MTFLIFSTLFFTATYLPRYAPSIDTGVFYEIFVRAFYDSDGDGIGDFKGIVEKLDYLNNGNAFEDNDLGISGIWLMPIFPSPSYHGYDVTDYYAVNSRYGTMRDFETLIEEAHKRGIKIMIDLVINHTSNQHPWFLNASNPEAPKHEKYRDYYVWTTGDPDGPSGHKWNYIKSMKSSYYSSFKYKGMPDLNFDNPEVKEEIKKIATFWLKKGVDGFRIDAAKHIFNDHSKNSEWWKEFMAYVKSINPNVFVVGEIWDSNELIDAYYTSLDSAFEFEFKDRVWQTVKFNSVTFWKQTDKKHNIFPEGFVPSIFVSNHDMDRPGSHFEKGALKILSTLLLTSSGVPFIYYGEEIGAKGRKPDENIREPMDWYALMEGPGRVHWLDSYKYAFERYNQKADGISVEEQDEDPNSLLNWYRKLIHLREDYPILKTGKMKIIDVEVERVIALKRYSDTALEMAFVFVNISKEVKKLDVSKFPEFFKAEYISLPLGDQEGTNIILPPFGIAIVIVRDSEGTD